MAPQALVENTLRPQTPLKENIKQLRGQINSFSERPPEQQDQQQYLEHLKPSIPVPFAKNQENPSPAPPKVQSAVRPD